MNADQFVSLVRDEALIQAIRVAESRTSGEVRVFVSSRKVADPIHDAWKAFARLKMHHTKERNAVLIFVAPDARKFAIVGDEGIHHHCHEMFWGKLAGELAEGFKAGDYTRALVQVIREVGQALAQHFPGRHDDVNELPDDVARE